MHRKKINLAVKGIPTMTLQPTQPNKNDLISENLQEGLLEALLDLDQDETYPWSLLAPETDDYFAAIANEFVLIEETDITLDYKASSFFNQLHQQWSNLESSSPLSLREDLLQKFTDFLPKTLINEIIEQAEKLTQQNLNQLNQVVECVKPLWNSWTTEDLQVFARPVVYAMRDKTAETKAPWEELTEFEQIRLTMTVAQEVIARLATPDPK
jgi:hypothetical protein